MQRRSVKVGVFAVTLLTSACSTGGGLTSSSSPIPTSSGIPAITSPSPSLSPRDQLDALLNEDPGLLQAICNEGNHLISVGWPPQMVPGLLSGKSAGVAMADKHDLTKVEATGYDVTKAMKVAMERCPS